MTDKSKWFVYKLDDGDVFGCFRIKPYNNPECVAALRDLAVKKSIFKMSEFKFAQEYLKIIAKHVIKDWENIELLKPTGKSKGETSYSPGNAYSMMIGGSIGSQIAAWVIEKANKIS
ncbi:MAG: hypothetical protein ACN6NV_08455 [Acinetobacter gandensis]|uniref:hypothetical protein n=1 Tax=Acinetobacter gandensis TaxID=1443941 RepID=UPI003D04331B